MKRRNFLRNMAIAIPAASCMQYYEAFMNNPINADGKSCNGDPEVLGYGIDMLKDGYLQFNDKPGLGITLKEELIKKKYMMPGETWWD